MIPCLHVRVNIHECIWQELLRLLQDKMILYLISYRIYYLKFSSSILANACSAAALFCLPLSVASSANFLVNQRSAALFARVSEITLAPIAKILQSFTSLHISAVNSHSHKPQRMPLNFIRRQGNSHAAAAKNYRSVGHPVLYRLCCFRADFIIIYKMVWRICSEV